MLQSADSTQCAYDIMRFFESWDREKGKKTVNYKWVISSMDIDKTCS